MLPLPACHCCVCVWPAACPSHATAVLLLQVCELAGRDPAVRLVVLLNYARRGLMQVGGRAGGAR